MEHDPADRHPVTLSITRRDAGRQSDTLGWWTVEASSEPTQEAPSGPVRWSKDVRMLSAAATTASDDARRLVADGVARSVLILQDGKPWRVADRAGLHLPPAEPLPVVDRGPAYGREQRLGEWVPGELTLSDLPEARVSVTTGDTYFPVRGGGDQVLGVRRADHVIGWINVRELGHATVSEWFEEQCSGPSSALDPRQNSFLSAGIMEAREAQKASGPPSVRHLEDVMQRFFARHGRAGGRSSS